MRARRRPESIRSPPTACKGDGLEDTGVIVGEPERVPNRLQRPGTALPVSGRERVSAKRRPATRQRQNLRLM